MRSTRRALLRSGAIVGTVGVTGLAGCTGGNGNNNTDSGGGSTESGPQQVSVKVGSKRFTEQEFFGALSMQSIRANAENADVVDETGLGGTAQVWRALTNGSIDHYWTYSNTQWNQIHGKKSVVPTREKMIQKLTTLFEEEHPNLTLLKPSQANAVWTIVVRPEWAKKHNIETISDFASYVRNDSTDFTFVTYAEFAQRQDGLPNLLEEYNIPQERWDKVNVKKVGYGGLNYQILNSGDAVATVGWKTQPQIYQYGLKTLEDDKGYFSTSIIWPVIRSDIVENNPTVESAINAVSDVLTTQAVQENVLKISNTDTTAATAAEKFLKANDVI
ncbi:glycine betaine ABC transporter substrate-binding protein [Halobellus sp. EA9]|uniref:glycine betaine ABC transporter substrate-binding protein n=1 Tax=Halobellus sp. EA9 TaxID=3421647 RepID=UPI003EC01A2C